MIVSVSKAYIVYQTFDLNWQPSAQAEMELQLKQERDVEEVVRSGDRIRLP